MVYRLGEKKKSPVLKKKPSNNNKNVLSGKSQHSVGESASKPVDFKYSTCFFHKDRRDKKETGYRKNVRALEKE